MTEIDRYPDDNINTQVVDPISLQRQEGALRISNSRGQLLPSPYKSHFNRVASRYLVKEEEGK